MTTLLQTLKQFPTFIPGQAAPIEEPWTNPDGPNGSDGGNGSSGGNIPGGGILACEDGCYGAPTTFTPTPKQLLFTVSPTHPRLYWRVFTLDEYTGSGWRRSTQEDVVPRFPKLYSGAGHIFTVELQKAFGHSFDIQYVFGADPLACTTAHTLYFIHHRIPFRAHVDGVECACSDAIPHPQTSDMTYPFSAV